MIPTKEELELFKQTAKKRVTKLEFSEDEISLAVSLQREGYTIEDLAKLFRRNKATLSTYMAQYKRKEKRESEEE